MIRILTGDCREVLASLPAESAQTCVTSPLRQTRSRVHQLGCGIKRLHRLGSFRRTRGRSGVAAAKCDSVDLRPFLHIAERQAVIGLRPLYTEEGEQGSETRDGAKVGSVPCPQVSPHGFSFQSEAPAKGILKSPRNVGRDLLEHHPLAENRSASIPTHAHGVGGPLNADAPIAVDCSSQVRIDEVVAHVS